MSGLPLSLASQVRPNVHRVGNVERVREVHKVQRQAPTRQAWNSGADENTRTHKPCAERTAVPLALVPLCLYAWR